MTVNLLSAEGFAALLERIERDDVLPDRGALVADDAADVELARTLFGLRTRQVAPSKSAWHQVAQGPLPVGAATGLPRRGQHREEAGQVDVGQPMDRWPVLPRRDSPKRMRAEAVLFTALLSASVGFAWLAMGAYEPRFRAPTSGTPAPQPAVVPKDRAQPALVSTPRATVARESVATMTTTLAGAYPRPPASSATIPALTATIPVAPTSGATETSAEPAATRERSSDPRPGVPVEQWPYPGPSEPASSATPEPRVTRIAPRPVPTAPPLEPTPAPTAPPWPTSRALPPTPTVPSRPTTLPTPDLTATPLSPWSPR